MVIPIDWASNDAVCATSSVRITAGLFPDYFFRREITRRSKSNEIQKLTHVETLRSIFSHECHKKCTGREHFLWDSMGRQQCHESSNWKNLKWFAPKKSKNDLLDASGAHFEVGNLSGSKNKKMRFLSFFALPKMPKLEKYKEFLDPRYKSTPVWIQFTAVSKWNQFLASLTNFQL